MGNAISIRWYASKCLHTKADTMPDQDKSVREDHTRQRIIDAALSLFAERGYPRTTTRAIADAANVNEVTLFRHFGNKKTLLVACAETFNATGFAANFEQRLSGDYATDIVQMAHWLTEDTANAFQLLRLLLCDAAAVPELLEVGQGSIVVNQQHINAYFQRQIDAGIIRPELDPQTLTFTLNSMFSTSQIVPRMLAASPDDVLAKSLIEQMARIFVEGTIRKD